MSFDSLGVPLSNILLYTGLYLPGFKGGGPIKSVSNLVHTTESAFNYYVVTMDRDLGDSGPYKDIKSNSWHRINRAKVLYCGLTVRGRLCSIMEAFSSKYDVVYLNSFMSPQFSIFPLLAAKLTRKAVILAPRGELSAGALKIKKGKKAAYLTFFKALNLYKGITFQASSSYEAIDIKRALGEHADVFVAENIGLLETPTSTPAKSPDSLKLVFLSRVSPMKNLLQAFRILSKVKSPVLYDVYGPIEDEGYWAECLEISKTLPENVRVQYKGELKPSDVVQTLSQYDLFFLPTRGENYGHVIAEAFCAGLPVLISDATPWRELEEKGIGWDLPLEDEGGFVDAIDNAARMSSAVYSEFRERVLLWAKEKFQKTEAIEANKALFRYALEKK